MLNASYILPAGRTAPKHCMMVLHGYCQNREYMVKKLAKPMAVYFPDMMFVIPNAPGLCRQDPKYYDWLRYDGEWVTENIIPKVEETAQIINDFTNTVLEDHDLSDENLLFSGFSQGAALALYTAAQRPKLCAGVLGYSGAVIRAELWKKSLSRPPSCLIYDEKDSVLPQEHYEKTIKILKSEAIPLTTHTISDMGHRIVEEGVQHGRDFLMRCLDDKII